MKRIFSFALLAAIAVAGFTCTLAVAQRPTPPVSGNNAPTGPTPCYPQSVSQPCPKGYHPTFHSEGGQLTGLSGGASGVSLGGSVTRDQTSHLICHPNNGAVKIDLQKMKPCPIPAK